MARCQDCFHWKACKRILAEETGFIANDDTFDGERNRCEYFINAADVAPRAEVAREIFEEIEEYTTAWCGDYYISIEKLDELKKKYTEGEK